MSLLGKILLVFNILAIGGYAYLATQDRKGRQEISASVLRHKLVLVGLPLEGQDTFDEEDGAPFVVDVGGVPTETVSKKLLETYLAGGGNGSQAIPGNTVVTNQIAEVKRVRALVESAIGSADGGAKAATIGSFLIFQAETYEERLAILGHISAGRAEELGRLLSQKFDAVLSPPRALESVSGDDADSRIKAARALRAGPAADRSQRAERLAHLLVHLDRDAGWQKRALVVVGAQRYAKAVAAQAARFREMANYVQAQIEAENAAFAQEYGLLRDQAIKRTGLVNDAASNRRRLEEQLNKDRDFKAQRQTQLDGLNVQLRRAKAEVDELLVQQSNIEKVLFEIQREVGLTLDDVYKLEAELERKERERFKSP